MIKRPSLGQAASLGTLYDAHTDTFVPVSLLRGQPPPGAVVKTDDPSSQVRMNRFDTYREKFNSLNVGAALSASFLAGFVSVGGSGSYLVERRCSDLVMQASLLFKITTVNETLNFAVDGIEAGLASESLDIDTATHVVTQIVWGACIVVTAKRAVSQGEKSSTIEGHLDAQFKSLMAILSSGEPRVAKLGESCDFDHTFEITIYGDVLAKDGLLPTDFKSASQFLSNVPKYIAAANNGKGKPLAYTMLPLSYVARRFKIEISREITMKNLSDECSEKFVQLFDELCSKRQTLYDYDNFLRAHVNYIPREYVRAVSSRVLEGRALEAKLRSKYASTLKAVRSGKADDHELSQLLEDFRRGEFALDRISVDTRPYTEKVNVIQSIVDRGAEYIGFNGESLDMALARCPLIDTYVFFFSEDARLGCAEWSPNFSFVHGLLDREDHGIRVLLNDCDAFSEQLTTTKVSLMRNSQIIIDDVLREQKLTEGKCIIRYNDAYLDPSRIGKPLKRIPVRIPCPGKDCSSGEKHDWVCFRCDSIVEYGVDDQYLYCNCGRCDHLFWDFKCSNQRHGLGFEKYNSLRLSGLLASLEPFEELNILILGPTGVGKSTWINAFANYLIFSSLDDALKADKLCWVIPFSFRTYRESEGKFEDINVRVGFEDNKGGAPAGQSSTQKLSASEDEHDGSAATSATQRTKIHRVQIGNLMVRLIDTPGVGDTRGPSKDKENMADILRALRQYDKLHGILILLKPNDQRLTLMFRFCIQELLTHLHRKAAQNIAFGFTNTRGTNYKPGDTFDPLRALLREHQDVEIGLYPHNVYCFDSESFRYLAAFKQHGEELGDKEENRRSWTHSVSESWKLLNYFKKLNPHQVNSTLNLNEIRHQIFKLTAPMAEIAEAISASISVNEDDIMELRRTEMTKKELEAKLTIQVDVTHLRKVDQPRTTCSHVDCIEHSNVGVEGSDGKPVLKTVYKSSCHVPCYLEDITLETVGDSGLKECYAMTEGICRVCGHNWMCHLHVKYEVKHGKQTINDPDIQEALKRNATATELKRKGIETKNKLIQKLRIEQGEITEAAARFSIFLKRSAIMTYNDATLEYLDRQMEEERKKINVGGSRDKLESLSKYRSQYKEQIETLEMHMAKGENHDLLDQGGVEECVKCLRSLELYGKSVKRVLDDETQQPMVYREGSQIIRAATSHFTTKVTIENASNVPTEDASIVSIEDAPIVAIEDASNVPIEDASNVPIEDASNDNPAPLHISVDAALKWAGRFLKEFFTLAPMRNRHRHVRN